MCEKRSASRKRSTCTVPGAAHAREVVAAEVDEHHVLGAVLLGGEQPLGVALARPRRARDRVERRARALGLDERLGRGADERDPVELEQEEVRRRVDAPERAVERERRDRGRRSARCESTIWKASPCADVLLARDDAGLVVAPASAGAACRGARPTRAAAAGRRPRAARSVSSGSPRSTSATPRAWSKRTSTSGTTKRLSGRPAPGVRHRHGRLELRDEVVDEVADDRLAAALGLLVGQQRASRSRPASSARAGPARPTRAGSSRCRRRAGGGTRRAG